MAHVKLDCGTNPRKWSWQQRTPSDGPPWNSLSMRPIIQTVTLTWTISCQDAHRFGPQKHIRREKEHNTGPPSQHPPGINPCYVSTLTLCYVTEETHLLKRNGVFRCELKGCIPLWTETRDCRRDLSRVFLGDPSHQKVSGEFQCISREMLRILTTPSHTPQSVWIQIVSVHQLAVLQKIIGIKFFSKFEI